MIHIGCGGKIEEYWGAEPPTPPVWGCLECGRVFRVLSPDLVEVEPGEEVPWHS